MPATFYRRWNRPGRYYRHSHAGCRGRAGLQSLIAVMNPAQLATSLQHMALQYRDLQNAATGTWETDEDDDRVMRTPGQWPAPSGSLPGRAHYRDAPEPTRDDEEECSFPNPGDYTHRHRNTHDDMPHQSWHTATADDEEGMANTDNQPHTPRATHSAPSASPLPTPQQAGTRGPAAKNPPKRATAVNSECRLQN